MKWAKNALQTKNSRRFTNTELLGRKASGYTKLEMEAATFITFSLPEPKLQAN